MSLPISPQEYHRQREAERLRQREELRLSRLAQVRTAVADLAPRFPAIERVYLFGSLLQHGRYTTHSDVDIAIVCDDLVTEGKFWSAMEDAIQWNVDVRPFVPPLIAEIERYGELVYERENAHPHPQNLTLGSSDYRIIGVRFRLSDDPNPPV